MIRAAKMYPIAPKLLEQLDPAQISLSNATWLTAGVSSRDNQWGLGCIACMQAAVDSPWGYCEAGRRPINATSVRRWFLKRHAQGVLHIAAAAVFVGVSPGVVVGAPSTDEFMQLLTVLQAGATVRGSAVHKGSSSDKVHLMWWCLAEATLEYERICLRSAETISLCRDARKQRLVVRFGASDKRLDVRFGLLGMTKDGGDTGLEIVAATRKLIVDFATLRSGPPRWYAGQPPELDQPLFDRITSRVEMMMSDAAANELLAGDIAQGRRHAGVDSLTPNVILVARDLPHSFRRMQGYQCGSISCLHYYAHL